MSALLDQAAVETKPGFLSLTEGAIREVKRILESNKVPESMRLRVGVTGGGCSGMSYQLGFDQQRENDEVLSIGGLEVLLDKRHAIYLMGTEVDFVDGLQGRGFEFKNPNAKKTCGCGSSFSA
ncbi:MAG: iron-sulfur cluster assembly accessory protein [Chloroherpetonaceae bacterium]|nr:iron-sulfur cluster assembly accessory protein [Chloroherpetonaceae bacterium]